MPTTTLRRGLVVATAVLTLCGLGACSSDSSDSSDTTTTTEATTTTSADGGESEATIKFDENIQQELADVGCHPGEVHGVSGPRPGRPSSPSRTRPGWRPTVSSVPRPRRP